MTQFDVNLRSPPFALGVKPLFVGLVRRGFQLKCRVLDGEMLGETALKGIEDLRGLTVVKARTFHDHVG
jgi:hypothetical protein